MHFESPRIDRVKLQCIWIVCTISAAYLGVDHDVASL